MILILLNSSIVTARNAKTCTKISPIGLTIGTTTKTLILSTSMMKMQLLTFLPQKRQIKVFMNFKLLAPMDLAYQHTLTGMCAYLLMALWITML